MTRRQYSSRGRIYLLLAAMLLLPARAHAACSSPSGNAGDMFYSSTSGLMVYCNSAYWIAMGTSTTTTYGTLTTNDFCIATSGTAITCTTASTGSGNVVLSASPNLTGTVAGANSTWSGQVSIGTTTLSGALNVNGTINATAFAGSGASLTSIGTSALGGITGPASSSTYLRGDGTWAAVSASIPYPGAGVANSTGSAWGTSYSVTGTGTVVLSASPTLTGTIAAANQTLSGTLGIGTTTATNTLTVNGGVAFQLGSDYTTTGSQSDVALSSSATVRYNGSAAATFYGIAAGQNGQLLELHNASNYTLTLSNQSGSESTAANKIITGSGADLIMASNSSVSLQYDNIASRWRVIGGSGGASLSGGLANNMTMWTGTTTIGTSNIYQVSGGTAIGIGTATPNASASLDVYSTTTGILLPRLTTTQMNAISSPAAGLTIYNTTAGAPFTYNGATWVQQTTGGGGGSSSGGGQLLGVYSSSTAVSNNSIVFTGASNSSPSLSGTTLTLPSNTSYIVVETWGGGGGGGAAGNGGSGVAGSSSCFGTNSTACTSPTVSAAGGGAGTSNVSGGGGVGSGGDVNLYGGSGAGGGNATAASTSYLPGGAGGSAPLGGGGGYGAYSSAGSVGTPFGGGGAGGGESACSIEVASGTGGGGGGYASKLINSPSGAYYYTIGSGGAGSSSTGSCGSGTAYIGGAGGTGGIKISNYASGVTSGSIGTGAAGNPAYYNASGNAISPFTSMAFSGTNVAVTGTTSFQLGSDYTTTGSTADVAINTSSAVRYNGSAAATFYGILAGQSGQILNLHNASSYTLTLSNQSGSESTAANKIITGSSADLAMASNSSVTLQYDNTASRWRVIGGSGSGATPAGTTGQVQYNSGSSTLAANSNLTFLSANNQLVVGTSASTPVGIGTTGNVATPVITVISSGSTFGSLSGTSGTVTVNPASTGQMTYYSGSNALSGTSNLYVSGGNIAIGTSTGSYLLSLDGQSARTIGMQRIYTSSVGQALTLQAGGAVSGGTNLNGGNLVLTSGVSTGTGTSSIQFQTAPGTAGSTTDNTVATAMTVTGAGNVGIGTTSPAHNIVVRPAANQNFGIQSATDLSSGVSVQSDNDAANTLEPMDFRASLFYFYSGNVGIGKTNPIAPLDVSGDASLGATTSGTGTTSGFYFNQVGGGSYVMIGHTSGTAGGQPYVGFGYNGSAIGSITQNGTTAVGYNTTSDRRLKENVVDTTRGLDLLTKLPVNDFNFIADSHKQKVQGFIAQELYKIYPEAVTTNGDDGTTPLAKGATPWSVDYGRLTPLLVKSIQELKADGDNLRSELKTTNENEAAEIKELRAEIEQLKSGRQ